MVGDLLTAFSALSDCFRNQPANYQGVVATVEGGCAWDRCK